MSSRIFLQALQNKLKGGNSRSIHLNALPGRLATRLDLKQLDLVDDQLSSKFLKTILTKPSFEFKITFDNLDLNTFNLDSQKRLGVIAKRLNSIVIENEDYYKEHGTKTLGFGYPILIKRSSKDPSKIIKAPLFIWPLDAIKSRNKVNEWSILRNKSIQTNGSLVDEDIHSVSINEVLLSFIKGEDDIILPNFTAEALEDSIIDHTELLQQCAAVLNALNPGSLDEHLSQLKRNFNIPISVLPDATDIDAIANNKSYIHFGGIFGLFRAQKESIITDLTRLLERFDEFEFENLKVDNLSYTPFSAVNTDPTQQAIINALGGETNQIIQGPPGTGKSQSLTALITNAAANGLKCLVVCEKKTALDVIKRNIEKTHVQMAGLVAVIDDVNEDRESIIDSVRDRQNSFSNYQYVDRVKSKYLSISEKLKEITTSINSQHATLAQAIYRGMSWDQIVGRYLQLRKLFPEVPLKHVLNVADFKLRNNESELKNILNYLGKADELFHQSLSFQEALSAISDDFLKNKTVGEARIKIEEYTANANFKIPQLETTISSAITETRKWVIEFYDPIPKSIKNEFSNYLPFVAGEDFSIAEPPQVFELEQLLLTFSVDLKALLSETREIKESYYRDLTYHYSSYRQALDNELDSYLNFVNESIGTYGQFFMKNNEIARFKTNFFSLVSNKYKLIKQGRIDLRDRIKDIQIVHLKKDYIPHEYNDDLDSVDLSTYVNNIIDLRKKVNHWAQTIPDNIAEYVAKINNFYCHKDFIETKQRANELLQYYDRLTRVFKIDYFLIKEDDISDLNQLIDYIPDLLREISKHLQLYTAFRNRYQEQKNESNKISNLIFDIQNFGENKVCENLFKPLNSYLIGSKECVTAMDIVSRLNENMTGFRLYHDWRNYYIGLHPLSRKLIDIISANLDQSWENGFECWYLYWILSLHEPPNLPKNDFELQNYKRLKIEFDNSQLENIITQWTEKQVGSVRAFKLKGQAINSLFNKKGAKGMRRNSLRTIIKNEFELFTDFFPIVLLNPSVCSSIIPLEEGIFDVVIFDEASQLRLEDTYASLIRGKAKIVSGDKHQMAPSSYFESNGALLDPYDDDTDNDDDGNNDLLSQRSDLNLADAESLLAFAVDRDFKESYLSVHYRSHHPYLIDFSNHAFYGKRLIPVPAITEYTPIEFIQVDGIYENQTNEEEATQVVSILRDKIKPLHDGSLPSVGVATFNIYQRNLILEKISENRRLSVEFDLFMGKLGSSFFVKNLENIQGDERDIIIISSTFGRKTNGSFSQNFGPIIQGKGHRMLNVIITRAKDKVYICNSFPLEYVNQYAQLIHEKGNKGRAILYAYLIYAKAVSEDNNGQRLNVLNLLSQYCIDQLYERNEPGIGSESIFEDEVFSRLANHIGLNRIEQQYKVGGFRIDMVIHPKYPNGLKIALECDGAKYHSSTEAYAWDIFRQEQLEAFGFIFYRIWSTKWWDSSDKELESLLDFIYKCDNNTAIQSL
ncbi:AAA domain-containing protein [Mucilaginibacter sp. X4EP1]|uniref:AAA domain-containing protein n=1 Tax=Mucilaginibacter sp. X4EP1 TaxID=2723092 RepID=UPI002168AE49|nr:AAA domain-containing protein [Mucilaginibacter sp. X4EP1]MCS3813419.1 superfamily I DNA and/or RNA helicase/very-short-patch-repair endonuclease [Mucilaginibacter sp. X4EP1]